MPNRILRDWTDSLPVNNMTVNAERFFVRLIMKADDFGRFVGNPTLLRASLFPLLLNSIREADITRWIAECVKAGLVRSYIVNGKQFLEIAKFQQRTRQEVSKYPSPSDDGQVTVTCQSDAHGDGDGDGDGDVVCPGRGEILPTDSFMRFWACLPPKARTRSSRKKCFDIWKKQKLEKEAEAIISGVNAWKLGEDWIKDEGSYIPGAHRFLNERKWDDTPPPADDPDDPPIYTPEQEAAVAKFVLEAGL